MIIRREAKRDFEKIYNLVEIAFQTANVSDGKEQDFVNESFKMARNMGYSSVVLVDDPAYYSRFGFMKTTTFGIKYLHNIPEEYIMACELFPNALKEINGTVDF